MPRDRRGSAAILFALSMPVLIGGLGLGFEVSNWYVIQRGMQNAADAAALAASSNAGLNYDVEAKAVAAQYGFTTGVTVANNLACPGGGSNCYSVTISGSVPLYLSPVVGYAGNGSGGQNLSATAIVTKTFERPYCVLALASSGAQGIRTSGAPSANLAGCSIKSNTGATCSGHNLGADFGDAVGTNSGCGVNQNSGFPLSADPYAGLAANIPSHALSSCGGSFPSNLWASNPNLTWSGNKIVCGNLQLTGNVIVSTSSGVLIIENGKLDTNGFKLQTSSGSALTIVFSGANGGGYTHATTDTVGTGTIDIAAPTSGPWHGVAIYQDPILTSGVDISAAGSGPTWDITGLVYLPHSSVSLVGAINKSTNGQSCIALVVDNLTIKGSGDILPKGQCPAAGLILPTGAPSRGHLAS